MSKKEKILIIEDEQDIIDIYLTKLESEGYKVKIAKNGREGVDFAKSFGPHIILLDIKMPEMDGYEALKEIKQDKSLAEVPVVMLTNLGHKEEVDKALELGADGYLIKVHFTPDEVMKKIEEVLKIKK